MEVEATNKASSELKQYVGGLPAAVTPRCRVWLECLLTGSSDAESATTRRPQLAGHCCHPAHTEAPNRPCASTHPFGRCQPAPATDSATSSPHPHSAELAADKPLHITRQQWISCHTASATGIARVQRITSVRKMCHTVPNLCDGCQACIPGLALLAL